MRGLKEEEAEREARDGWRKERMGDCRRMEGQEECVGKAKSAWGRREKERKGG